MLEDPSMGFTRTSSDSVAQTVAEILPEIVALRHELHQHPEIRFEEECYTAELALLATNCTEKEERSGRISRVPTETTSNICWETF